MRCMAFVATVAVLLFFVAVVAAEEIIDPIAALETDTVFIDEESDEPPPWSTTIMEGGDGDDGTAIPGGDGEVGLDEGDSDVPRHVSEVEAEEDVLARASAGANQKGPSSTIRHDTASSNQTAKDTAAYVAIAEGFENMINDWCCAVTGKALYTVSGDQDVFNYLFYYLSQMFDNEGQQYGGRIVLDYHLGRPKPSLSCDMIDRGKETGYSAAVEAVLRIREELNAWLEGNEVDPAPIVTPFSQNAKQMTAKFVRSRMLFTQSDGVDIPRLDEAVMKTVALVDTNDLLELCTAGGDYYTLANGTLTGAALHEIESMLVSCVDNGKLAENPVEFGEVLLSANREKEGRALFDLAVERGRLCNAYQRPEAHHRKDLVARPVWPMQKAKFMLQYMEPVRALLLRESSYVEELRKPVDEFLQRPQSVRDSFLRMPVFSRNGLNYTLCEVTGEEGCELILQSANQMMRANDAYELACNGSLTIELWGVAGGQTIPSEVGVTNLVLQALWPLSLPSGTLTLQVGEETAILTDAQDEPLIFDDSFEHTFTTGGSSDQVNLFLHAQICHPSMHDKVLDQPSTECATFDDESDEE